MSQQPHHDSSAFLEVVHASPQYGCGGGPGWYVRRCCDCHRGVIVSRRFDTEREAYRCLWVLDDDCRQRLARRPAA